MATTGIENATTIEAMEQQQQQKQHMIQEPLFGVETNSVCCESTILTVGETYTVVETTASMTVDEMQKTTTDVEHKVSEGSRTTASICASIPRDEITTTMNDSGKLYMDKTGAANCGNSMDELSGKTEDYAEEKMFTEEDCKEAQVNDDEVVVVGGDSMEEWTEVITGKGTETMEEFEQVDATNMTTEVKEMLAENELEMACSVAATLGSSVDRDSVLSLNDMSDCTSIDDLETIDASMKEETLKNAEVSRNLATTNASFEAVLAECEVASSESAAEINTVAMTTAIEFAHKADSEKCLQEMLATDNKTTAEIKQCLIAVDVNTISDSGEVKRPEVLAELLSNPVDGAHALINSPESASAIQKTAKEVLEHEAENATKTPLNDSLAKLELHSSLLAENIVHECEVRKAVSPRSQRTSSAMKLDLSDSAPVKNVVHRFEAHQEDNNALENLKIRTKRNFFSEKQRSISVSHEKEKYNAQTIERAKKESEAKDQLKLPGKKYSLVSRKSSAISSVRNMASRFEKKVDQSLDNLSFRTVRSFFPTEKSIHVGAEKQKYEAIEQEKQSAKEIEEKFGRRMFQERRTSTGAVTASTERKDAVTEEPLAEDTVAHGTLLMDDMPSTPTKPSETAAQKANCITELHPRRHTVTAKAEILNVRGIAHRFETKRANSVVTAPVRTIDTFIVADSEASVRVSTEKAKYENQMKTSAPPKRTIDTFIVPKSEASVCVSTEKAKFETPEKQVKATVRTIDTFIVPNSESSICVSAVKAKLEMPEKQSKTTVRTIDTFIVPDSEASVRVSAEKAKFEAPEKLVKATVRTIDTFIVPESEVSIRVVAEKEKLEALEKLKQSELEAQAALDKQKCVRAALLASEKVKLEEASRLADEFIDDVMMGHDVEEGKLVQDAEVATKPEVTKVVEVALDSGLAPESDMVMAEMILKNKELVAETTTAEEADARSDIEVSKDVKTVVVKVIDTARQAQVAAGTKEFKKTAEINAMKAAMERACKAKSTTAEEAEVAEVPEVTERATKVAVAKVTKVSRVTKVLKVTKVAKTTELSVESKTALEPKLKQSAVIVSEVARLAEDFEKTEVKQSVEAKGVLKLEKVDETEGDTALNRAVVVEEVLQTEEAEVAKAPSEIEIPGVETEKAKEVMDLTAVEDVKKYEVVSCIKKAMATEEIDDIGMESKNDKGMNAGKEMEEVMTTEAMVKTVEKVEIDNKTLSKEKQEVQNLSNLTIPGVEVTVERQTFGDSVSTAQHAHWLSLPASVNPALARLHTVLRDHDPLTAYALYPSSPPSSSS